MPISGACAALSASTKTNWGEPERAPHRRVCCEFSYVYSYRKLFVALILGVIQFSLDFTCCENS